MLYNIFVATANYFMGFLLLSTKEYQGLYLLSCYKQLENEKNVWKKTCFLTLENKQSKTTS